MKRSYNIFLDVGTGGCMAHVLGSLLGCNRTARNQTRAIAKIKEEIVAYSKWLRAHGQRAFCPSINEINPMIAEAVRNQDPWIAGGTAALFQPERESVTSRDIQMCLRRMSWNREDLLKLVCDLPAALIRRKPRGEPRSIQNTLCHIAVCEIWYISRLERKIREPKGGLSRNPFKLLAQTRKIASNGLLSLTPAQRRNVYVPKKWCSPRQRNLGEQWTAKKVLRRLLEHERQHTQYIERLLREQFARQET
ncbi:MAG: DinB family protein [Candidatus Eisenbacteria bacterium]|nr:DinB family protein [Candidatus Eisenbacteria bacterium]